MAHSGVHRIIPPSHSKKHKNGPPTLPHLKVVPLPPLPLPPPPEPPKIAELDTKAILDEANQFAGLLKGKETGMTRLFRSAGDKARRGYEHLRILYQLKLSGHVQQLRQGKLPDQQQLNRWVVSSYKLLGFTVLTIIVVALVGYLASNVFYWFSSSWVEPTVIEPTDERVIALSANLAQQTVGSPGTELEFAL